MLILFRFDEINGRAAVSALDLKVRVMAVVVAHDDNLVTAVAAPGFNGDSGTPSVHGPG
jgi:hypothetical protein